MSMKPSNNYNAVVEKYVSHYRNKNESIRPTKYIIERNLWAMAEYDYACQSGSYCQLTDDIGLPKSESDNYYHIIKSAMERYTK